MLVPNPARAGSEMELKGGRSTVGGWLNNHVQKATCANALCVRLFDSSLGIRTLRVTWVSAKSRVGVDECSRGKLFKATWVDRVVLPVAIATHEVDALLV